MGTVLQYCTGADEVKIKLERAEKENESLKKELISSQDAYRKLQSEVENSSNDKILALSNSKNETTQKLLREQKEKKMLKDRYKKTVKRASEIHENSVLLLAENEKLKKELAARSSSAAEITEGDEESSDSIIIKKESGDNPSEEKDASPRTDMVALRNWLIYKNLNAADLKTELAKLLTMRGESHRSKIPEAYKQRYGADIMDDINKIIRKGHVLELVDGLFRNKFEYDAYCIRDVITNRNNKNGAAEIADIICCRNVNELQLISHEYKKLYGHDMKDKIYKLSKGKTYQNIINHMFTFKRNDNETTNKIKIAAKIQGDVEYLMDKNIKWKKFDNKLKLALLIIGSNKEYICNLNQSFFASSNINLFDFIDGEIGENSTSGQWLKVRIDFCSDNIDFYARKIQILGDEGWNKGRSASEINRIFISTFDNELKLIQKKFNKLNYGDNKTMIQWVIKTCKNEKYSFFLTKMLQNCTRI